MLHTEYQGSRPCDFGQEEFFMFSLYHVTPAIFGPARALI